MLFKQHDKSLPLNFTHYATLYPQNGDRIVTIDSVTSFHPMYNLAVDLTAILYFAGRFHSGKCKASVWCLSVRPSVPWLMW